MFMVDCQSTVHCVVLWGNSLYISSTCCNCMHLCVLMCIRIIIIVYVIYMSYVFCYRGMWSFAIGTLLWTVQCVFVVATVKHGVLA